jgi:hypothetical protein
VQKSGFGAGTFATITDQRSGGFPRNVALGDSRIAIHIEGMNLELSDEETAALTQELNDIVESDRYPLSPHIRTLRAILSKLSHQPLREPLPPPKVYAPPRAASGGQEETAGIRVGRFPHLLAVCYNSGGGRSSSTGSKETTHKALLPNNVSRASVYKHSCRQSWGDRVHPVVPPRHCGRTAPDS